MSDVSSSRPLTRAASKQNYAAKPVTAIRNKFEKPRGHIKAKSMKDDDVEDEFADLPMAPAFPGTETFIETPTRPKFAGATKCDRGQHLYEQLWKRRYQNRLLFHASLRVVN